MGFFSKILGIDSKRNKARDAQRAREEADKARQKAEAQVTETNRKREEHETAMLNLQRQATQNAEQLARNQATDLRADSANKVVAGGTAEDADTALAALKKKPKALAAGSLADVLGINI